MNYIKKNKLTVFIIVIFVLVVLLGGYLYNLLFTSGKKGAYGNRLDGMKEVEITETQYNNIEKKLKENENVIEVTTELKGKIVNIIITVKDEVTKDAAKNIAAISLNELKEDQLKFYDIQVFVKKNNEELNDFPIIGYKQNTWTGFSWTKDRQVTKDEAK